MYQRIRDLREDKDLKQKDLAAYLNCSQVCYSYYEIGKREIPAEVLISLAKFYGVSVDYLLGLTDVKSRIPRGNSAHLTPPKTSVTIKGNRIAR